MKELKKFHLIFIAAVSIAIFVLLIPVKLPYTVESYGKIVPVKQWILERGADGELIACTVNNQNGMSEGYTVLQISRGETMRFSINSSIMSNGFIAAGDTIGIIYSSEAEECLTELNGQLLIAQANLAVNSGGKKESIINEVEQRLAYAKAEAVEQQKILSRLQGLYQKEFISQEEYEIAQGKANLLKIEISIAESELEAVTTGEKPEKINLINSQIEALQQDIAVLQKRLHSFAITSPFAGKVSRFFSSDTLLIISDVSAFVALIPVKLNDCAYISKTQGVRIDHNGSVITDKGQLLALDNEIRFLNGEQIRVATALLTEYSGDLLPGMISRCKISCQPVTALEYVKRLLNFILD